MQKFLSVTASNCISSKDFKNYPPYLIRMSVYHDLKQKISRKNCLDCVINFWHWNSVNCWSFDSYLSPTLIVLYNGSKQEVKGGGGYRIRLREIQPFEERGEFATLLPTVCSNLNMLFKFWHRLKRIFPEWILLQRMKGREEWGKN
jgi:hypothetical protein